MQGNPYIFAAGPDLGPSPTQPIFLDYWFFLFTKLIRRILKRRKK